MISCTCHVQRLERHGGGKKKGICGMLIPLLVCFQLEVSVLMSVERPEGWGLVSDSVCCTPSPLNLQRRGKEGWQGPTVHSPANLCGRSRSGRALASRSERIFMTAAKVYAMLLKPGM